MLLRIMNIGFQVTPTNGYKHGIKWKNWWLKLIRPKIQFSHLTPQPNSVRSLSALEPCEWPSNWPSLVVSSASFQQTQVQDFKAASFEEVLFRLTSFTTAASLPIILLQRTRLSNNCNPLISVTDSVSNSWLRPSRSECNKFNNKVTIF